MSTIKNTTYTVRPDRISNTNRGNLANEEAALIYSAEDKTILYNDGDGWEELAKAGTSPSQQSFNELVIVNQDNFLTTICGTIDSSKEYFLDGVIDIGSNSVTIPPTGITIRGYSFDLSGLVSSENNHKMFISQSIAIGSGNFLATDVYFSTSGTGSKVYELYDSDSTHAIELTRVNYINCTSLGDIYDYRQGLEFGTGRFGGSPTLTLNGVWAGGFRITTSIVRGLSASMTDPLFKEGLLFQMNSRFLTDINCDLPASAALIDFQALNFPNPGTIQFVGCEITRNGVYNADDTNLTPNIKAGDLPCYWKRNNGLSNTYVGGTTSVTSEELTVIGAGSTWYTLEGIFTGTGLQHFSASADGKLTHLGNSPREFTFTASLTIESNANNELAVRFRRWDNSASQFVDLDYTITTRQVNSLVGGRDVAFFTMLYGGILDQNDYIQLQVRNNSGNQNVTMETGSFVRIQER